MEIIKHTNIIKGYYELRCSCGRNIKRHKKFARAITQSALLHDNKTCICDFKIKDIKAFGYKPKNSKHLKSNTKVYKIWAGILARCNNKNRPTYKHYGSRGIKVLWKNFNDFYKDMGEPPLGYSIDRIDNNGHYCKENCKWSSQIDQMNNTRNTVKLTYNNETHSLRKWSEITGLPITTLRGRYQKQWDSKAILTTPYYKSRNIQT